MQIVTLTMNPALDASTTVDRVVAERKLRCGAPVYEPGGGGINVARALRALGGEATAIFPVGGPNGQALRRLLSAEGVAHLPIEIEGDTRESFVVLETSTNLQYRFMMPGPTLTDREYGRCLAVLTGLDPVPDYIVASGSLPPGVPDDFYARVVRYGRERGARVIVDTSGEPLRQAVLAGAYLVKPNRRELEYLVDRKLETELDQEAATAEILAQGPVEAIAASLGAGGVLLATRQGRVRMRAPTVRVQSRVGAGDSMVAGIVRGLTRGDDLTEAIRLGIAAGAAATMTPGTQLCRPADVERLVLTTAGEEPLA